MYTEVLTARARKLLPDLVKIASQKSFYLAGGTALALQYGHRRSVDFDFFSQRDFDTQKVWQSCKKLGAFTVVGEDEGTLHGTLGGVRLTFLHYPYKLLKPLMNLDGLKMASSVDIACMKFQAIASRGSRKDFVDLYFILQRHPLQDILVWFDNKYGRQAYSRLHLLKSLTYFIDADKEPNPRLIQEVSWSKVKIFIRQQVKDYL